MKSSLANILYFSSNHRSHLLRLSLVLKYFWYFYGIEYTSVNTILHRFTLIFLHSLIYYNKYSVLYLFHGKLVTLFKKNPLDIVLPNHQITSSEYIKYGVWIRQSNKTIRLLNYILRITGICSRSQLIKTSDFLSLTVTVFGQFSLS